MSMAIVRSPAPSFFTKGTTAYTIVESDGHLPEDIVESIHQNTNIHDVMVVQM